MDYETLRLIWWALLGILLIGLAIMDGFDLGTAILVFAAGLYVIFFAGLSWKLILPVLTAAGLFAEHAVVFAFMYA